MIPAKWDRRDPAFLAYVHTHVTNGSSTECLFCTRPADSWCHIQHGSNRSSDFLGFPACNGCHHQLDHAPRGRQHILKAGWVKVYLAEWFAFGLPPLLNDYTAGGYQAMLEDA